MILVAVVGGLIILIVLVLLALISVRRTRVRRRTLYCGTPFLQQHQEFQAWMDRHKDELPEQVMSWRSQARKSDLNVPGAPAGDVTEDLTEQARESQPPYGEVPEGKQSEISVEQT